MKKTISLVLALALGQTVEVMNAATTNQAPIADAGLSRYAGPDPIVLDGTGSYDPDDSGPLSYTWRQIAGPSAVITDPNTATPTIEGFVQTDEIQECEFVLVVSDGQLTSLSDTVKVIIVPDFSASALRLQNPPFNPDKPTVIFFGGGDCVTGATVWKSTQWAGWEEKANIIIFPNYEPDSDARPCTYYRCGDMIIVYLSSVAPDYKQPIQSIGFSTGEQPAIDVGIHLNRVYRDARYAVNRVTNLDGGCRWNESRDLYFDTAELFWTSVVDGEQCWVEFYYGEPRHWPLRDMLAVCLFGISHGGVMRWYQNSLTGNDMNNFNSGLVAGAYWSVIGPGKNLQLAKQTDAYFFRWDGDVQSGGMTIYDEALHPGRLPEPLTLVAPVDVGDPNGAVLTCRESENAIGYQLLFGSDPYRVMDYSIISDTPVPPNETITTLPFEVTWWTVRVYDEYGSTIYADPKSISMVHLSFSIENTSTGKRYSYIQDAIDDAAPGDEIVIGPGTYHENISLENRNLNIRSTNPNDPDIVAATIIYGVTQHPVITFSGGEGTSCVLDGFTISGGVIGVSCQAESLTIKNCTIDGPDSIEFWYGCEPTIIDCTILGQIRENDPSLIAHWRLDETEGDIASDSAGDNDAVVMGDPVWQPTGGQVNGAIRLDGVDDYLATEFVLAPALGPFSVLAWVKGGTPGQVIISQVDRANWLMADAEGKLVTRLMSPGRDGTALSSQSVITDGQWHRVGLTWDGSRRTLCVDGLAVAEDTQTGLMSSDRSLFIGCGSAMEPGTFWSGLIDDVRVYNRAVNP